MKPACELTDHSIDSIMAQRNTTTKNKTSQIIDDVTALRLHYSFNAYSRCPDAIQIESLSLKLNVSPSAIKTWFRNQRQLAHKKKSVCSQVTGLKQNVVAQQPPPLTEADHPYFQTITHRLHTEKTSQLSSINEKLGILPVYQQRPPPLSTLSDVDNAYLRSLSKRYNTSRAIPGLMVKLEQPTSTGSSSSDTVIYPSFQSIVEAHKLKTTTPNTHRPSSIHIPSARQQPPILPRSDHLICREGEDKENIVVKISGQDEILTSKQMVEYMKQIYSKTNLTSSSRIQKSSKRGDGLRKLALGSNNSDKV